MTFLLPVIWLKLPLMPFSSPLLTVFFYPITTLLLPWLMVFVLPWIPLLLPIT